MQKKKIKVEITPLYWKEKKLSASRLQPFL